MFRQLRAIVAALIVSVVAGACSGGAASFDYSSLPDPTRIPYVVRPGDLVHVRVLRNQNTTGVYTVRPDGRISIPLGGEIKVAGQTTKAVHRRVVASLKKYLDDAQGMVSVAVDRARGVTYSVIGEVARPGSFESPRYVTVLEALANAGGLTPYAKPHRLYVLRRDGDGKQLKIPFSYPRTVADPSGNRNFYLLSGDILVAR